MLTCSAFDKLPCKSIYVGDAFSLLTVAPERPLYTSNALNTVPTDNRLDYYTTDYKLYSD